MKKEISKNLNLTAFLVLAVLATLAAMDGTLQAQPSTVLSNSQDPIVGTWLLTVQADDDPPFLVYETYAPGGALSAIDNEAPASQETVAVGTWAKVGPRKYFEDQWQLLFDADGNFAGTWIGHIEDDIDAAGTYMPSGPFTYVILDPSGNVLDSGKGISSGFKMPQPRGPQTTVAIGSGLHQRRVVK
jgi:hypothetical protein